jgi:sarcosine oxidase subunit gamma
MNALGGNAAQVDKIGHLTLSENNNLALASVSARLGNQNACHKHVKALIGDVPGPRQLPI